jgi:thiol-disulfide isomerase/thioredoxin
VIPDADFVFVICRMKLRKHLLFIIFLIAYNFAEAQTVSSWKVTKLQDYIEKSNSVLVINFWATFCKPCLEELPYYQAIVKKYKPQKVKLVMVSMDLRNAYRAKVTAFVKKNKFTNKNIWLNETNADYFCPKVDKDWMGGIPATLFVNNKSGYRKMFEQQMEPGEFETELRIALTAIKIK